MASKRSNTMSSDTSNGPPSKRKNSSVTNHRPLLSNDKLLSGVESMDDMDMRVLRFQNQKLSEQMDRRHAVERELKQRIEELEGRQATVDSVLNVVNRHWNQLDEDLRVMLERFDHSELPELPASLNTDADQSTAESGSFLETLYSWDRDEIDHYLSQRVQFSWRLSNKLVTVFNKLQQRHTKLINYVQTQAASTSSTSAKPDAADHASTMPKLELAERPTTLAEPQKYDSNQLSPPNHIDSSADRTELVKPVSSIASSSAVADEQSVEQSKPATTCLETADTGSEADQADIPSPSLPTGPKSPSPESPSPESPSPKLTSPKLTSPKLSGPELASPVINNSQDETVVAADGLATSSSCDAKISLIGDAVVDEFRTIAEQNAHLQSLISRLQSEHHSIGLRRSAEAESRAALETERDELSRSVEALRFDLEESKLEVDKLQRKLNSAQDLVRPGILGSAKDGGVLTLSEQEVENFRFQIEENKNLAQSRLLELEQLEKRVVVTVQQLEKAKLHLQEIPDDVIKSSIPYKALQAQFSLLLAETQESRSQLLEAREVIVGLQEAHRRELSDLEQQEFENKERLRQEIIALEERVHHTRSSYDEALLQLKQAQKANENLLPVNKELRSIIGFIKTENQQLKNDLQRRNRKLKDAIAETSKVKSQLHNLQQQHLSQSHLSQSHGHTNRTSADARLTNHEIKSPNSSVTADSQSSSSSTDASLNHCSETPSASRGLLEQVAGEADSRLNPGDVDSTSETTSVDRPSGDRPSGDRPPSAMSSSAASTTRAPSSKPSTPTPCATPNRSDNGDPDPRELQRQIRKLLDERKEMKSVIESWKKAHADVRDKAMFIHQERKLRGEIDDLKKRLAGGSTASGGSADFSSVSKRRPSEDEAMRKIRRLEESLGELQKKLHIQKQEEDALAHDMEVTMKSYEELMEKIRELQKQIQEKDDLNFKLMSEQMISNQLNATLKEEIDHMKVKLQQFQSHVDSQNKLINSLEQRDNTLLNQLNSVKRELCIQQHNLDLCERKGIEHRQSAEDLRASLEKYQALLKEAQTSLSERTSTLEAQIHKQSRAQEELTHLRKKVDRYRQLELASNKDEVLMEEIKQLKEQLQCPSCKDKNKDTVLTKCFHVFCKDCIQRRYDTRQRKCPKCNAGFGLHDYHRIYLT